MMQYAEPIEAGAWKAEVEIGMHSEPNIASGLIAYYRGAPVAQ